MSKRLKILVIIPKSLPAGVIQSQIIDFFEKLNDIDILYVGSSLHEIFKNNNYSNFKNSDEFFKIVQNEKPDFAYIRSATQYIFSYKILKKAKVKIIYAYRALIFAESFYRNKNLLKSFILLGYELFAYFTADKLTAVTYSLRNRLYRFFLIKRNVEIIPCVCLTDFKKSEKVFNKDIIKIVYVGGISKWQALKETLNLYVEIKKRINNVTLTIYTGNVNEFKNIIKYYNQSIKESINIFTVPRGQLLKDLTDYDIGLLLRKNNIVNKVASPIKFYEYVNAGVIPIITPYIGDISENELVKNFAFYYDFNQKSLNNIVKEIQNLRHTYTQRTVFINEFNEKNHYTKAIKTFKKMMN